MLYVKLAKKNSFITNTRQLFTIQSNLSNILKTKRIKEKEIICILSSYTANPLATSVLLHNISFSFAYSFY